MQMHSCNVKQLHTRKATGFKQPLPAPMEDMLSLGGQPLPAPMKDMLYLGGSASARSYGGHALPGGHSPGDSSSNSQWKKYV